jgi:raffinose/stachyose/melibiose transport system permease protein
MHLTSRWSITRIGVLAFLSVHVLVVVFPFVWMAYSTLKTNKEFMRSVWSLPATPSFDAFVQAWSTGALGTYSLNSLIVMLGSTALAVVVATAGGYALAIYRPRWLAGIEIGLMIAMAIPAYVLRCSPPRSST